jgi:hypothetical protein
LEYDEGKDEGFVEVLKIRGKQHNLTKLQASTCYKFRLAAVNACGKRYVDCVIDPFHWHDVLRMHSLSFTLS